MGEARGKYPRGSRISAKSLPASSCAHGGMGNLWEKESGVPRVHEGMELKAPWSWRGRNAGRAGSHLDSTQRTQSFKNAKIQQIS